MAESSLSVEFASLKAEVARFLGYATLSDAQKAEVESYVQAGVRQFYYPPMLVEGQDHEWSFLKPMDVISTEAESEFSDLPDDFGRITGNLHFNPEEHLSPILVVSEGRILILRQREMRDGRPAYAAVQHMRSDGTTGQRQRIIWWPTPSDVFELTYRYEAYAGKLTDAKPYPLGGMKFGELITESCLSIAESRANDEQGIHWSRFGVLLAAAIMEDRRHGAVHYGPMGGGSEFSRVPRRPIQSQYEITYKGETW